MQPAIVIDVEVGCIVASRTPPVLRGEINGVGSPLQVVHRAGLKAPWSEEKRSEEKTTHAEDPTPNTGFTVTVGQPVSLHVRYTGRSGKDLV